MLPGVLTRERHDFRMVAPLQLRHSLGMLPNFPEYSFSSLPQGKKQGGMFDHLSLSEQKIGSGQHYNIEKSPGSLLTMPVLLTTQLNHHSPLATTDRLSLTAEERSKSRHPFITDGGQEVYLQLKRGTNLRQGDRLQAADESLVIEILAKPEQVMVVSAQHPLDLLQAAYHLGNRHVPLEITDDHLYLLPDSVLRDMLLQRGLTVEDADRPFQPQAGAYESAHHHH